MPNGAESRANGRAPGGRPARLAIVGCGHVGSVTAACMAELGHAVAGVDVNRDLVPALQAGRAPFLEPGLDELLQRNVTRGRLRFTTSYDALTGAEFVFLCMNTPSTPSGAADLRHVRSAVGQIAAALAGTHERPVLVIKSTSPIGTLETIEATLKRQFGDGYGGTSIAANPEFLRESSAVADFFAPDRIVVGADSPAVAERVVALYAGLNAPAVVTDLRTAELVKYVSNAFLATRLSFINEVARLCERLGADVDTVVRGVALDPRIGGAFFTPGIGYGGSCLPKDVAALAHTGETVGVTMRVLNAVRDANTLQRQHAVNRMREALGSLEGKTIAVWGATFKGGTEDLRESPALAIVGLLRNEGAHVHLSDPALPGDFCTNKQGADLADRVYADPLEAVRGAACLAILTDWPEFATADFQAVERLMDGRLVYDGRNLLRPELVIAAGLTYIGVGRGAVQQANHNDAVPACAS